MKEIITGGWQSSVGRASRASLQAELPALRWQAWLRPSLVDKACTASLLKQGLVDRRLDVVCLFGDMLVIYHISH